MSSPVNIAANLSPLWPHPHNSLHHISLLVWTVTYRMNLRRCWTPVRHQFYNCYGIQPATSFSFASLWSSARWCLWTHFWDPLALCPQWHSGYIGIATQLKLFFKSQVFEHWHCVIGQVDLDILNNCDALHILGLLEREDEGTVIFQNVRNYP
jgi:hypothetical protein